MAFNKYQHLERIGTSEVQNIELGLCYIFPKIDGTNASIWFENGELKFGSRNREINIHNDNAGFANAMSRNENLFNFFAEHPNLILYGEWLIPHSFKKYRDDAWSKFYVFDVCSFDEGEIKYYPYNEYSLSLAHFSIDYINPLLTITNPSYEDLVNVMNGNNFLVKDGEGTGEGIVIKRYDFVNKYGRTTWAKMVTSEFREVHAKEMGAPSKANDIIEEAIVNKYVTSSLVDKEYSKITVAEDGWHSKSIPRLLHMVYYSLITEEAWNFTKEHKNPVIDFKRLQYFTFNKVKNIKPELF